MGLAEVTAMPSCRCLTLPKLGDQVAGEVIWHADHNCQVKVRLEAWGEHPVGWSAWADAVGQVVAGTVTRLTPIGVFVRVGDCVEGLIPDADLPHGPDIGPASGFHEGQAVQVRVVEVDLIHRRMRLAAGLRQWISRLRHALS